MILDRFRAIVVLHPRAIAIEHRGRPALTFAALAAQAGALAARLRSCGVRPGDAVGILLEKSPETIVAMLAIWTARAAFVPLDPQLPRERLEHMVRDAGVRAIVAREAEAATLPGVAVTFVDPAAGEAPQAATDDPRDDDDAYVIYTSGTTGVPKGVVVTHRGIVDVLAAQITAFDLGPTSRALLYLSTSFDASISDIGTALLSGATLCIEPEAELGSIEGLSRLLRERAITHVDLPPSLLELLDPRAIPPSLRTVVIGGEVCPPAVVRAWAPRVRLVNVYGPTEATICASLCECDARWDRPLIGRPIPGVTFHVLDEHLAAVADGELCIGGPGLAREYRNRPDLTAAKFLVRDGERLYRTGDRVVRRGADRIEFLGRIDRQVKIRGMLVEPEEIEARLAAHPDVREAAVVKRTIARPGRAPRDALVAFVAPRAGAHLEPPALAEGLTSLPRWMIPHRIEVLASLPRAATGKIDLGALAARPLEARSSGASAIAPHEALLAAIWSDVLGVGPVDAHDDFVALGGDSLAALEIAAAAEAHGIGVVASDLFRHRTIAALLAHAGATDAMSARDLRADVASLPPLGRIERASIRATPRAIFLTGATGFLGARVLDALLARTGAIVHCLVRAPDVIAGLARIDAAAPAPRTTEARARIRIVCGDLERDRFGLTERTWRDVAETTDAVHHLAARVSMALPYGDLRAANVLGTREALRLALEGRPKRMHVASTLSVFVATDRAPADARFEERDTLATTTFVHGGYAQTKWAAEALLQDARRAGAPIAIYRFGLLTGDAETGPGPRDDALALFVRGIAAIGCVPEGLDPRLALDVTPVAYAAAAMAELSLGAAANDDEPTFHIANPSAASLGELLSSLRAAGVSIAVAPLAEVRARVVAPGPEPLARASAYLALCRAIGGAQAFARHRALDLFQATDIVFARENTERGLAGSGLRIAPPRVALASYIARIVRAPSAEEVPCVAE